MPNSVGKSLILVITGASRGFGRSVALALQRDAVSEGFSAVELVLIARSEADLLETSNRLLTDAKINVVRFRQDLADLPSLSDFVDGALIPKLTETATSLSTTEKHFIFVNNAGNLGPIGACTDLTVSSLPSIERTINLNISSALYLSSRMAAFAEQSEFSRSTLINISSLVAVQPFPTLALYSAGKAARDAYHKALAEESPTIRVLNYAPGPLETDMTSEIRQAEKLSASLKEQYARKMIDPAESASVLSRLVFEKVPFESGQHVDFYDVPAN